MVNMHESLLYLLGNGCCVSLVVFDPRKIPEASSQSVEATFLLKQNNRAIIL